MNLLLFFMEMINLKIAIAGLGYVGLSIATLLSLHNCVTAVDVPKKRVDFVNQRISPIEDKEIEYYFKEKIESYRYDRR